MLGDFSSGEYANYYKLHGKYKPYRLEIMNLKSLVNGIDYLDDISITAEVGDVVKIVINDEYVKEQLLYIMLVMSNQSNSNYSLLDVNGRRLNGSKIRKYVNYIPNKIKLKNISILENIKCKKKYIDLRRIYDICKMIELNSSIIKLPNGINTIVADDEFSLTKSFLYRIVMARELIEDKPIIVFDEPDLFLEGKVKMNQYIRQMKNDHIIVIITTSEDDLNLNEKTIELCSYNKAKIDENLIYRI